MVALSAIYWSMFIIRSSTFKVDFAGEIEKRKYLLQPVLTVLPLDEPMLDEIAELFPSGDHRQSNERVLE